MSFFKRKSHAVFAASTAMTFAAIPLVGFGVAASAGMANDAGRFDKFEQNLQSMVLYSSLFYLPALLCLPISLALMVVSAIVMAAESVTEKTCGLSFSH